MKLIQEAKAVWWAGLKKDCSHCGCVIELEAGDVRESEHFRGIQHHGVPLFKFSCPVCTAELSVEKPVEIIQPPPVSEAALDWPAALEHLSNVIGQYIEVSRMPNVNVSFAMTNLRRLKACYDAGARTPELHQEMMEVK